MNFRSRILIFFLSVNLSISVKYDYYDYEHESVLDRARAISKDWCSLKCQGKQNIACKYGGKCSPNKPCTSIPLDEKLILEAHNKLRHRFAAGEEELAGGIQVANMMELAWDDDLAFTASCNLVECGEIKHDQCHTTPKFPEHTGQNLWTMTSSANAFDCASQAIVGIQSWYDEVSQMNQERLKADAASYKFDHKTGHFTQVIWATTTHVGCALTERVDGSGTTCTMACNYGPGGNRIGQRLIQIGEPCSACSPEDCVDSLCRMPDSKAGISRTNQAIAFITFFGLSFNAIILV